MNKDQILTRLKSDAEFALNFAIDNNQSGVIQALQNAGYKGGDSKSYAQTVLMSLMEQGHKQQVISLLSSVDYLDYAPNYTGGLKDYFLRTSPPLSTVRAAEYSVNMREGTGFPWTGVLAGLGAGLSTFAGLALGAASAGTGSSTPASATPSDDQSKKDKTKKILLWGGVGLGAILLIVGLYFALRKKPETNS